MITQEEFLNALAKKHSSELQDKFTKSTVAICGLGGLGSNIAVSLARAGVGKLILIDFDRIEITNLNRQQYKLSQIGIAKAQALPENLREINPFITLEAHNVKISERNARELLKDSHVICEAFDNAREKAMLTNYVLENMPEKYLVAASGMAGVNSPNEIRTRKISKRFYLCGDEISDVNELGVLLSARVMLCAAHQALTVLRILANLE